MSSQQRKRSSSKVFVVTFSDEIEQVKLIPRLRDSLVELSFYQDHEISSFRYEAFCAAIGVDPDLGDDSTLADAAIVIFDDSLKIDKNSSSLSMSNSFAATSIQVPSSSDPSEILEIPADIASETRKACSAHLTEKAWKLREKAKRSSPPTSIKCRPEPPSTPSPPSTPAWKLREMAKRSSIGTPQRRQPVHVTIR
jgi:hypothetical protein